MKTICKLIFLLFTLTYISCMDDNIGNDVKKTDTDNVSGVLNPQWLADKVESIAHSYNPSPATGEYPYPWVYSVKHNKLEYILIVDALESCWTCGHLYFTNSGETVEPLSELYNNLEKEKDRTKLWPKDDGFPATRAQGSRAYVYTPKGTLVTDAYYSTEEYSSADVQYVHNQMRAQYHQAIILDNATTTYNCHAYAWYMTEGGAPLWMGWNTNPTSVYWTDGSYTETTAANATKVAYLSSNHSAVTTTTTDVFISKWGNWPLMRHNKNHSPYDESRLKYYKRTPPTIVGPNNLNIQSIQNYHLDSRPAGTVTWEVSGNKFTVSPTTGTATIVSTTNITGTGTLTAKENGTVVATKSITVSSIPTLGPMTGPNVVQPGQTYVSYRLNLVSGLIYNWGSSEGILTEVGTTGDSEGLFNVSSSSGAGTDTVHCTVKTTNGTTVGVFYMNVSIEY